MFEKHIKLETIINKAESMKDFTMMKMNINLRGHQYEILLKDIDKLPVNCRLVKLKECLVNKSDSDLLRTICDSYDLTAMQFYFNRDPEIFNSILDYLNDKKLHINTTNMCVYRILEELSYWSIDESFMEPCCSLEINKRKANLDEELEKREKIISQADAESDLFNNVLFSKFRKISWDIFEHPHSSVFAMFYFLFLICMIFLSTIDLVLRTIPDFKNLEVFDYTEIVCVSWFTLEWILRFLIYPKKIEFLLSPLNIADLISIVPFYVYLGFEKSDIIEIIKNISRTFRSFSVLKIMKHSSSVQTLMNTLKYSYREIAVYLVYLGIGILTFSCFVYYSESLREDSKFISIPATFW